MEEFVIKKLGDLETNKNLQKIDESVLLVSYDFNSAYSSAQADKNSNWLAIETVYTFKKMSGVVYKLFDTGR